MEVAVLVVVCVLRCRPDILSAAALLHSEANALQSRPCPAGHGVLHRRASSGQPTKRRLQLASRRERFEHADAPRLEGPDAAGQ